MSASKPSQAGLSGGLTPHPVRSTLGRAPLRAVLDKSAMASGLSEGFLVQLEAMAVRRACYRGETVVEEGDADRNVMLILSGVVRIQIETLSPHREITISRLGVGELLGEFSLFDNEARSATAVAEEPSDIAVFDAAKLEALCAASPKDAVCLYRNVGKIVCDRLRVMNRRMLNLLRSKMW